MFVSLLEGRCLPVPDRSHVITVEAASTGGKRSIRVDVADNNRSVTIRADRTYDTAGDAELAVNLRNETGPPGSVLFVGADWQDLQGNGQTFTWTTHEEINIFLFAHLVGAWSRGTSVPADSLQKPVNGNVVATFEIGEDGWLRPNFHQSNDFYVSFRTLEAPQDITFNYTTRDKVETILRSPLNREAGFDADFGTFLDDCILTAEEMIDEQL